jgi:nucleotide-binding universal stress UspA family protein
MTLLAPTRFTEESSHAVNAAAALARKRNEPLVLAHVLPRGILRSFQQLETAATAALTAEAARLTKTGVHASVGLLSGGLDVELARAASESGARLAIVGDSAKPYHPVRGGTLEGLVRALDIPVMVVRDARPFEAWARGEQKLRVTLALEPHAESLAARDWVGKLAEYGEIDLTAVRIWWPEDEYARRALPKMDGHRALETLVREETEALVRGMPAQVTRTVRLEIGIGQLSEQLTELANKTHADLLVMGTHRRRGLGRLNSVSERALETAPMSVACVPLEAPLADLSVVPAFGSAIAVTDLSEEGNRAISYARAMLESGLVHVLHVSPEPFSAEKEAVVVRRIAEAIPSRAESHGGRLVIHVRHGDLATEIASTARQLGPDVVCLSGPRAVPLAQKLVASSGLPVLIAPQPGTAAQPGK